MRVVLALTVILLNYLCEAHNTIYEWGKLNNSTTPQRQPYLQSNPQLFASTVWRQIAYGNAHQLYLTQDGKLYSAGSNSHGQLGNEPISTLFRKDLKLVEGIKEHIIEVAAGYAFSVAITSAGEVYTFGQNDRGQLGTGEDKVLLHTTPVMIPQKYFTLNERKHIYYEIEHVCAGDNHVVVITKNQTLFSWGDNSMFDCITNSIGLSQVGMGIGGMSTLKRSIPYELETIAAPKHRFLKVSCGANHTIGLAVDSDGPIMWGDNSQGQMARSSKQGTTDTPGVSAYWHGKAVAIVASGNYNMAILSNGDLMTWGTNIFCNKEKFKDSALTLPAKIYSNVASIQHIAASPSHALFMNESGIYGCGSNSVGQLGTGVKQQGPQNLTKIVIPYADYTSISAGEGVSSVTIEYDCQELSFCNGEQHGVCAAPHQCKCEVEKFTGDSCQYIMCNGHAQDGKDTVCSGKGTCIENLCKCSDGFVGVNCETEIKCYGINAADPKTCSGHGTCISQDKCDCKREYYMSDCSINIEDERMTKYLAIFGTVIGLIVVGLIIVVVLIVIWSVRKNKDQKKDYNPMIDIGDEEIDEIDFAKKIT